MVEELSCNQVCIVDIETSGFLDEGGAIVEIGMCLVNVSTGEISPLFQSICKELSKTIPCDAWIFQNSDLDYDLVLEAPLFQMLVPTIQHFLLKYTATAFNQEFEFGFLENRGIFIPYRTFDPMIELTSIMMLPPVRPDTQYKWPKQKKLISFSFPKNLAKKTPELYMILSWKLKSFLRRIKF